MRQLKLLMKKKSKLPTLAELIAKVEEFPELAKQIKRVPVEIQDGWTTETKAMALAGAILTAPTMHCMEIGVWCGRGLIPMALTQRFLGKGYLASGIDPYSAPESSKGQTGEHLDWWSKVDHESIYKKLLENIEKFRVGNSIKLDRQNSDDVFPFDSSVLSIDGNHGDQAIRDVARFAPKVVKGGFVFLDDLNWTGATGQSVLTSILVLEALGFKECFRYKTDNDDWGCWRKIK